VDGEGRGVHRPVAIDDLTTVVDQDEVPHSDQLEIHPEWVDPEMVWPFGIPGRDVTGEPLVEPEMAKEAEGGGEALLAVPPLVLDIGEGGEMHRKAV
jgi:hypothetical protein